MTDLRGATAGEAPVTASGKLRAQWAALALAAAVIAFLAWRNDQAVYADRGRLSVRVEGRTAILAWTSSIDLPMARRIEEAYGRLGPSVDGFVLELHSPGGSVLEGRAVIATLTRIARTHDFTTFVGPRRECLSMCVPIFLAGEARIASRGATFMFHEPSSRDVITGGRERRPAFEARRTTDRFVERYFEASPMDPAWRAALVDQWSGRDVWKTGEELVAERSGVVTALVE